MGSWRLTTALEDLCDWMQRTHGATGFRVVLGRAAHDEFGACFTGEPGFRSPMVWHIRAGDVVVVRDDDVPPHHIGISPSTEAERENTREG